MNAIEPQVSVVVIGRNEGERLRRSLLSVQACDWQGMPHETIYVDSKSSDGSLALAASLGAQALLLDDDKPCAAKARNLGWRAARGEFVMFLDGDTELHPDFIGRALAVLADDPGLCAAWGHLRESDPGQSIYTRVMDLDWIFPVGHSLYFGGNVLVRRAAIEQAGGFDPTLKAGEEPELCARLRALGWTILHIDAPMARHDLALRTLRGWALRAFRSGIAYAEVADRMRALGDPLWQRESRRDLMHGIAYALLLPILALSLVLLPLAAVALLALAAMVLLRTTWRCRWKAPGQPLLRLQYAVHTHLQKIPALAGQLAWRRSQRQRSELGLVEYKQDARPASGRPGVKDLLADVLAPAARSARVLGRKVWIGRGVSVLKGVRIGRNSIVGANAVVTRSLADNSRATEVPARNRGDKP